VRRPDGVAVGSHVARSILPHQIQLYVACESENEYHKDCVDQRQILGGRATLSEERYSLGEERYSLGEERYSLGEEIFSR
jgi:hypothetical protein